MYNEAKGLGLALWLLADAIVVATALVLMAGALVVVPV